MTIYRSFTVFGLVCGLAALGLSSCATKTKSTTKAEAPTLKFETPEATLETWRQAVLALHFPSLLECYTAASRAQIEKDIAESSQEGLRATQVETKQTEFVVEKIVYEGNRAYLRILRKRKKAAEIEIINMVKEGGLWKIIP